MPFPIVPAIAAATSLIGMGIAKGKDKRQLTQQEKLQNLQIRGEKEMMDYGMQQQYDMWQKTNYKPQMEEMKKAGINPALMYGMGGGGGTTTGTPTANVTGAEAPKGSGRETEEFGIMGMQLASQIELQNAQRRNIDADTKLKQEGTLKTSEEKDKLSYENIINDLLTNRDEEGNPIDDPANDKNRLAFKIKAKELIGRELQNANIDQDTKSKVIQLAQKWKELSLEERKTKVAELTAGEQKDQDQIINIINTISNIIQRFIPVKIKKK